LYKIIINYAFIIKNIILVKGVVSLNYKNNFPKFIPKLSNKDKIIHDDFMKVWLNELKTKKKFNLIENFNHNYSAKSYLLSNFNKYIRTLEIGCGIGNHIDYENLKSQNYHVVDIRTNVLSEVKKKK